MSIRNNLLALLCAVFFASPANAQSLSDKAVLGANSVFTQRVQVALLTTAIAVSSDGLTAGGVNQKRHIQAQNIMIGSLAWSLMFAPAVATDATVVGAATQGGTVALTAGNVVAQQAMATDASIANAVSGMYNAFFGGQ
jgi:hypothetical protein